MLTCYCEHNKFLEFNTTHVFFEVGVRFFSTLLLEIYIFWPNVNMCYVKGIKCNKRVAFLKKKSYNANNTIYI